MVCSKCGTEIEKKQNFCTECGTPVNTDPETEVLKDVKSSKLNMLNIFTIVFGFISIFTCFWWFISIPVGITGIIFALIDDKRAKKEKSDYKSLLNIIGISLAFIIIAISVVFSLLEKEYITENYSIRYGKSWSLVSGTKNMQLTYKNDDKTYLAYDGEYEFPTDIRMSSEDDRKDLYETYYSMYKKNAKVGAYYLSTENSEFYKISLWKDIYLAYISYTTYDGNYGRFYILASQSSEKIITFMTYSNNKFTEASLHDSVIKILRNIEFIK
ncbi:MAG: zinc ribbon domain-containing protein [Clostridia bacterium]|nr:zinc ribbon domain-containing protein [Clostridia bacterium]